MRLSGQEYVDMYATDAKKRDKELRDAAKAAAKASDDAEPDQPDA